MNGLTRFTTARETACILGIMVSCTRRIDPGEVPAYTAAEAGRMIGLRSEQVRRWLQDGRYATFFDLVDLLFVKNVLVHGISLHELRRARNEENSPIGGHHFTQRSFSTRSGASVVKQLVGQLQFHKGTGFAEKWFPLGPSARVVVDPRIAFGAPTITNRGVKTANVFDLYQAERKRIEVVCDWMELTVSEVEDAVRFERGI